MSGSSLDGLDIVFVHFHEQAGKWSLEVKASACYAYSPEWLERLRKATGLSARDYCLLHADYGHFLGKMVNRFVEENDLHMQMDLIASHGHTTFHFPAQGMTAQLGDGASIAAETGVAVVSDLRNLDMALGGQGAPIVPIGEQLLFPGYTLFLNIGGIANISFHHKDNIMAFDVCPANRVLNALAGLVQQPYDQDGDLAKSGIQNEDLLQKLNELDYYKNPWPKSLANEFGTETIFPIIQDYKISVEDQLRTFTEHIAIQVRRAVEELFENVDIGDSTHKLLITGGGAFNRLLVKRIKEQLEPSGLEIVIPESQVINYKEAIIMALLGVLRWRENNTTLASVTGARRNSIGGALWMGQEGW